VSGEGGVGAERGWGGVGWLLNTKCFFLFSPQILSEIFLFFHSKKN